MWVPTIECTGYDHRNKRELYDYSASDSFRKSSETHTINYLMGEVSGFLGADQISMGNKTAQSIQFLNIESVSSQFRLLKADGFLGLAPSPFKSGDPPVFME